jgi:hypothetical protein
VVDVVVDVVVVVVVPTQTNKELDSKYTFPPLVPGGPCIPVGYNTFDALGTNPVMYDELTAKLAVVEMFPNNVVFSG